MDGHAVMVDDIDGKPTETFVEFTWTLAAKN